jgi:cytochrome P450
MSVEIPAIPAHVPRELVYDFNPFTDPRLVRDPQKSLISILAEAPRIFYTPRNGGHWMTPHTDDTLEILRQPELFSSDPQYNLSNQRPFRTIPNQYDPPDHTELRRILNPLFSPGALRREEPRIRGIAIELIEQFRPRGRVEFVSEIAEKFPTWIFLHMAGSSLEDGQKLVQLADGFVRSSERDDRMKALDDLGHYIEGELVNRRRNPGADIFGALLKATFHGRPLTTDELIGAGTLLFLGGLDTTASAISFTMHYLARNPLQYRRLVDDPAFVDTAIEELLRAHGGAMFERGVVRDVTFRGVSLKKGDRFVFMSHFYGHDSDEVADPLKVDLDREISRHMIFGAGPHRCLGSHLARIELRVFLEEWIKRIPEFSTEGEFIVRPGVVWMPEFLNLVWTPA